MTRPERTMLLDTASLYYRAFHALPDSITSPEGTAVNAVRGLLDMIAKLIGEFDPTRLIACWDDDWRPRWRVDLLPGYKAQRAIEGTDAEETPLGLQAQLPVIREVLTLLGIPIIGAADHEADDVIGTLASMSTFPVDIVTGDRDLFQLVDDDRRIRVISTVRGMGALEIVDGQAIQQRYGVSAAQYADFATLRGDSSDGLPGVPGVGEKTAAALLNTHGDLVSIRAAAARGEGMSPTVAGRIVTASAYLDVAPTVVRVVRDLDLPQTTAKLTPPAAQERASLATFAERWNISASISRVLDALDAQPA